jgi:hypothetical protein
MPVVSSPLFYKFLSNHRLLNHNIKKKNEKERKEKLSGCGRGELKSLVIVVTTGAGKPGAKQEA